MDLREIAETLVAACRNGNEADLLETHYAKDAVSVEAMAPPGSERDTKGIEGIRGKHRWWQENFEVHDASVQGPYLHGPDRFAVIFEVDSTMKQSGQRSQMKEVAIYTVKDSKIVREEFFYAD